MNKILLIFCCLLTLFGSAQPEKNNWYFGVGAALSFETGKPVAKYDNPQKIYGASASISHPVTGKLLFYTNGTDIWNNKHQIIANGGGISVGAVGYVLIVPDPARPMFYYVFFTANQSLRYVVVNMNQNGGAGYVERPQVSFGQVVPRFTAVYHPYKKSFWVIAHVAGNARFSVIEVDSADTLPSNYLQPPMGLVPETYGDMVANHAGTKLAVTHYQGHDEQVEVFDFDPVCGRIIKVEKLDKINIWDHPYGAAFSPDDSKLYINYSIQRSQLVQYAGVDFQDYYLIAESSDNLNMIREANDGKLYLSTHDIGIPGPRIDAVLEPNKIGVDCNYEKTHLTTDDGTGRFAYFELPAFILGKQFHAPVQDDIFTVKGTCLGPPTEFTFLGKNPIDSLRWDFGEGGATSTDSVSNYTYQSGGKFVVTLTLFKCGEPFVMRDTISINSPPQGSFPLDTILCHGSDLELSGPAADQYLWSTGETTPSIIVIKAGLVWLKSTNGTCSGFDSIEVSYHSTIFTALGDEYFICDDDKELAKLDAGGDFIQYKWTPTGDTTQWIIVSDLGEYFVVVKDFRGCDGSDGTKVERRCPVSVFYPNAFTPNADRKNDVYLPVGTDVVEFSLAIYNAWGQQIFKTKNLLEGWDGTVNGKPAPDGTYIYQSSYSGYRNKQLVSFETNGNLTLLR